MVFRVGELRNRPAECKKIVWLFLPADLASSITVVVLDRTWAASGKSAEATAAEEAEEDAAAPEGAKEEDAEVGGGSGPSDQ